MKAFIKVLGSALSSLPIQLLLIITVVALFGHMIDTDIKSISLAISLSLKEILVSALPIIIFSFIASCLIGFGSGTISFVILLMLSIVGSNYISTVVAYFIGIFSVESVCNFSATNEQLKELVPYWSFSITNPISNVQALLGGLLTGVIFSYIKNDTAINIITKLTDASNFFLKHIFIPVVPIFILGFVLKLEHEGALITIIRDYCQVLAFIALVQFSYVILMYGIATAFKPSQWLNSLKNALPSLIVALSTMSSAASLPLAIDGAEKNTNNKSKSVKGIVSSAINFHMIGDNFTIVILALAIMVTFGKPLPTFMEFFEFSLYFTMFRFAVAAVPGGGIIVMTGILANKLGFTNEMISIITAIYILFDGIITSTNVLGNGAFPLVFIKLFKRFR